MSFLIINAIPNETINKINLRFNLHLTKNLSRVLPGIVDYEDIDKFEATKKFMETNEPVEYECNKY